MSQQTKSVVSHSVANHTLQISKLLLTVGYFRNNIFYSKEMDLSSFNLTTKGFLMKHKLHKIIFALMSLALVLSSGVVCVDEHGDINLSFVTKSGHHDECEHVTICCGDHSTCGDMVLDLSSMVNPGTVQLKFSSVGRQEPTFVRSSEAADPYVSPLSRTVLPSRTLHELSTVVITT